MLFIYIVCQKADERTTLTGDDPAKKIIRKEK